MSHDTFTIYPCKVANEVFPHLTLKLKSFLLGRDLNSCYGKYISSGWPWVPQIAKRYP